MNGVGTYVDPRLGGIRLGLPTTGGGIRPRMGYTNPIGGGGRRTRRTNTGGAATGGFGGGGGTTNTSGGRGASPTFSTSKVLPGRGDIGLVTVPNRGNNNTPSETRYSDQSTNSRTTAASQTRTMTTRQARTSGRQG